MSDHAAAEVPVSKRWLWLYAAAWFGFWLMVMLPGQIMLAQLARHIDPQNKVGLVSLFQGVLLTTIVLGVPVLGYLCDRTRLAWGRRRAWALGGFAVAAAAFIPMGAVEVVFINCVLLVLVGLGESAVLVALSAMIADQVPVEQRGRASVAFGVPQVIALAAGMVVVTEIVDSVPLAWVAIGTLAGLCALPFLLGVAEPAPAAGAETVGTLRQNISPPSLQNAGDYYWAMAGRVLINAGNLIGTFYLLYYVDDVLHRPDPDGAVLTLTLIYLAFCIVAGWLAGHISDALGHRKPLVVAGGGLQAAAALTLVAVATWPAAWVAAALLGLGYGTFLSVDQALTTDVLPSARTRARDLGLINAAQHLPIAPFVGLVVLASTGENYSALYLASAIVMIAGIWSITRIRSVR